MITVRRGNLLKEFELGNLDAMMHGCNCFHGEDSGIAAQIWQMFPKARKVSEVHHESGDFDAYGNYSAYYDKDIKAHIINAYTQFHGGANFSIHAFKAVVKKVEQDFSGSVIGIPLIGCGIGGGDLEEVVNVLLRYAPTIDWRMYVL